MEPPIELRWEVCIDCLDPEALAPFWVKLLGYRAGKPSGPYLELTDPSGRLPTLLLQKVPERKQGKNRLHLDLYTHQAEALLDKALRLGASPLGERHQASDGSGDWFQVLTDPAGNEFCVCTENSTSVEG